MTRDARELSGAWTRYQRHAVHEPAAELAGYVERYWVAEWTYDEPYRQLIVPYPNVHLTFRDGRATVNGVSSGHQIRVLSGTSGVVGVAFRPGCFRPFLGAPVSSITDRAVPAEDIFGAAPPEAPPGALVDIDAVEEFLRALLPEPDPRTEEAARAVAAIAAGPRITRVDLLARELDSSVRRLQRLFSEYVGIGPKWVIRRYRLHEVTERLAAGGSIDWAGLSAELGYTDQAHFVHDFTAMFGESPTWYAARY